MRNFTRAAFSRVIHYRPAIDTIIGVTGLLVATGWSLSVISASPVEPSPAAGAVPAPSVTYVVGPVATLSSPFVKVATAACPAGDSVIGGGAFSNDATLRLVVSRPTLNHDGWQAAISNQVPFDTIKPARVSAYAVCAKPGVLVVIPEP